jgi:hypothetical protein
MAARTMTSIENLSLLLPFGLNGMPHFSRTSESDAQDGAATEPEAKSDEPAAMTNGAVNNFTINNGQQGDGSLNYDLEGDIARHIKFVKPPPRSAEDQPPPDPPRHYSPPPRVIEYRPAQPAPFAPDPPHPSRHSNPEAESGPRTEPDGGLKRGWYMDLPPTLKKKHWME